MVGKVKLKRPYFWCKNCSEGFYPLDEALNLSGRKKQWDMQKAATRLAAEVPYEKAEELFKERIQVLSCGWRQDRAYSELASGSE
jgi:hypothetical protein